MRLCGLFSKQVINSFFTEEKKGEFVALIIDDQFIENLARKLETTVKSFLNNLSAELFSPQANLGNDPSTIVAIVALQVYAASGCEKDGVYSATAYNPRLCNIINYNSSYLQSWYKVHQEKVWERFYEWCSKKGFLVRECQPTSKGYRFIKYPMELSKYSLNREDLKFINSIFYKYEMQPHEDIFYSDFWRVISINSDFGHLSKRISTVFERVSNDTGDYEIVKSQIYNHYINWDGEYLDTNESEVKKGEPKKLFIIHLSDKNDIYRLDVRSEDGAKIKELQLNSTFEEELKKYYSYKRNGIVVFQRNNDGDLNYWDEIRFIGDKNQSGLALVFKDNLRIKFCGFKSVYHFRNIIIYEFKWNVFTNEFYSAGEQIFELIGGLRIGRLEYLVGGAPILRIKSECSYIIDGEVQNIGKGDYNMELLVGEHNFKFPKSRSFKINMVELSNKSLLWSETFCKWDIDKRGKRWSPDVIEDGIVGLNFESYSKANNFPPTLEGWAKIHQKKKIVTGNNISLKLLNKFNKYE